MGVRDRNCVWANEPTRPRVLLECSPHDSPDLIAGAIERQGFDVGICTGPTESEPCDLLEHGACALVDRADVVFNMLCSETGDHIADAVGATARPPAVVVEVGPSSHGRPAREFSEDVETVATPVTSDRLVAALYSALERNAHPGPCWGDGV